jgi:catechol 2,3-dioxygenase-like lactoylglutathione lyase family enzyme
MAITGIQRVVYGAADLEKAIKFQEDCGLECVERNAAGADFELLDGGQIWIRAADDPGLPPANINWGHLSASTAREMVWRVDDADSLDAIGAELTTDRDVRVDASGGLHSVDSMGNGMGFALCDHASATAERTAFNTVGNAERIDRPADGALRNRTHPRRLNHMVYWVPDGTEGHLEFYVERLGFRVTDYTSLGTFTQCGGSTDHHNMFLQDGGEFAGFQHVAYEVVDFDEIMMLGTRLEAEGWKTNTGPLRHNIGSSLSWYMWNPAGGVMEILCDLDYCGPDWVPRHFDSSDPGFYGHAWVARPEHENVRPAQWVDD